MKAVINKIMDAGLSVKENEHGHKFTPVIHVTIIGGVRKVEFYPTTGTVYANPVKGEFRQVRIKKSNVETAIKVAKFGR